MIASAANEHHLRVAPVLLVADCLHKRALLCLVQAVQLGHVVVVELKVVQVRVALDSGGRVALRERYKTSLQTPADENLGIAYVVLLRDALQCRIVGLLVADERAVCFDDDVVVLAVFHGVFLLAPRVELGFVSELPV